MTPSRPLQSRTIAASAFVAAAVGKDTNVHQNKRTITFSSNFNPAVVFFLCFQSVEKGGLLNSIVFAFLSIANKKGLRALWETENICLGQERSGANGRKSVVWLKKCKKIKDDWKRQINFQIEKTFVVALLEVAHVAQRTRELPPTPFGPFRSKHGALGNAFILWSHWERR